MKRSMTGEEKTNKAKEIAESLKRIGYPSHMARTKIEADISIFGNEKEEIFELVKQEMS